MQTVIICGKGVLVDVHLGDYKLFDATGVWMCGCGGGGGGVDGVVVETSVGQMQNQSRLALSQQIGPCSDTKLSRPQTPRPGLQCPSSSHCYN